MAVALRGYTQAVYASSGTQTVAWPAGTSVGDFAVLCMLEPQSGKPNSAPVDPSVWKVGPSTGNSTVWGAPVTAAMLAAGLAVKANVAFLATFSGCGGIGRTSKSNGVQVTNVGGGLFVFVRDDTRTSALTPAGGKLGTDVLNGKNRNRRSNVWFVAQSTTGFKKLSSTNATYFTSLELLPALPPAPPTLLRPGSGNYINPSVPNTFTGRHNHPTMPQSRVNLRVREKTVPGAWQYLWGDGTLNATSSSVASAVTAMTLASGQLSAGVYEWQMQTAVDDSGSPLWSLWSDAFELNVAPPPVVNTVTVTAAAGDLTPDVAATRTLGVGSQVAWQLRITPSVSSDSSQVTLWDSGVTPGDDLAWTLDPIDWTNGASYKAWLRIQQTGGQWSAWTSGTFTVSWTPPAAPSSVTFTQAAPPTLTVAGVSGRDQVQVQYSEDAGATWLPYITLPVSGSSVVIPMPLAAYGVARRYRARASSAIDGTQQWSAWTQDQPVELRRNSCTVPRATTSWGAFAGTGGTVTLSVAVDARWKGGAARRAVWTVAGTGLGYVSTSSGTATMAVGETWLISLRVAVVGYTGALSLTVGGTNSPTVTSGAVNTIDHGDGTLTLWRTVTCTSLGAGTGAFVFFVSLTNGQVGYELWAGDAIAEKGATSFGGYFDGGYSPDSDLTPSWAGTANASESILSDSQASTDRGAYLVGDDGTYLAVRLRQDAPRRRVQPISVTYGLTVDGAATADVDYGPVQGWAGSTTLLGVLPADQAAIIAFWDSHLIFIIRWPAEVRGASIYDAGRTKVARTSEVESARIVQIAATPRDLNFDWVEQ